MNIFPHLLMRMKNRGVTPTGFIDAGAHFGETNEYIQSIYPGVRVVSFEANPNCAPILTQRGIEFHICLLGDKTVEKVPFHLNPKDPTSTGCSIFREKTEFFENSNIVELPMYRLDEVVPIEAKMNFLKMDVQGAELNILDGAERILPAIDYIFLEVSFAQYNEGAPLFGEVFDYIRSKGYHITDMCEPGWQNDKLLQCNFLFER